MASLSSSSTNRPNPYKRLLRTGDRRRRAIALATASRLPLDDIGNLSMKTVDVEQDLQRRVDESREWMESGVIEPILGLKVRNFPCKAEPVMFLDDPGRE